MANRVLTRFFPSKKLSAFLKRHDKKSAFDLIDLLMDFDIDVIADFIACGNGDMTLDQGYESLDNYIQADERRSYMSAALDLLCEFDMDKHALSSLGVPAHKIKQRMDQAIEGLAEKVDMNLNEIADQAIESAVEMGNSGDESHKALNPEVGDNLQNEEGTTSLS